MNEETGQLEMSYTDFLHCMTPYNNGELLEQSDIEEYLKNYTPEIEDG